MTTLTAPADVTIYDTLLPDPKLVYAVQRVICERGAFIDEKGNLWVRSALPIEGRSYYRKLMHLSWVTVAQLMLSKQVRWDDRAYCYMAAKS